MNIKILCQHQIECQYICMQLKQHPPIGLCIDCMAVHPQHKNLTKVKIIQDDILNEAKQSYQMKIKLFSEKNRLMSQCIENLEQLKKICKRQVDEYFDQLKKLIKQQVGQINQISSIQYALKNKNGIDLIKSMIEIRNNNIQKVYLKQIQNKVNFLKNPFKIKQTFKFHLNNFIKITKQVPIKYENFLQRINKPNYLLKKQAYQKKDILESLHYQQKLIQNQLKMAQSKYDFTN